MAAVVPWPVPLVPYGRRGGVARPLGFVWPLWGRGPSPGPCMATVGACLVPWTLYSRRGGVARPIGPV